MQWRVFPSSLHTVIASHASDVVLAGFTQDFGVTGKAHIHRGAKTNAAPAIELAMVVPQGINPCYSARGDTSQQVDRYVWPARLPTGMGAGYNNCVY